MLSFLLGYFICSFVFCRYHRLLVQKYGSKRDKAVATKEQAAKQGLLVQEAERVMDFKLFLEGQTKWEADSPHCLMMLYEMF